MAECTKADYNDGERMTLKDYSELWIKDYAEKHLRQKTVSRYKSLAERITAALGHKTLGELKPTHVIQFYSSMNHKWRVRHQ